MTLEPHITHPWNIDNSFRLALYVDRDASQIDGQPLSMKYNTLVRTGSRLVHTLMCLAVTGESSKWSINRSFQYPGCQLIRSKLAVITLTPQLHCHTIYPVSYQALQGRFLCIQQCAVAIAIHKCMQILHTMWRWMEYIMSTFFTCSAILKVHIIPTLIICGFQCLQTEWCMLKCLWHFEVTVTPSYMSLDTGNSGSNINTSIVINIDCS